MEGLKRLWALSVVTSVGKSGDHRMFQAVNGTRSECQKESVRIGGKQVGRGVLCQRKVDTTIQSRV